MKKIYVLLLLVVLLLITACANKTTSESTSENKNVFEYNSSIEEDAKNGNSIEYFTNKNYYINYLSQEYNIDYLKTFLDYVENKKPITFRFVSIYGETNSLHYYPYEVKYDGDTFEVASFEVYETVFRKYNYLVYDTYTLNGSNSYIHVLTNVIDYNYSEYMQMGFSSSLSDKTERYYKMMASTMIRYQKTDINY